MGSGEFVQNLMNLTEKVALLTAGLKNVETSLSKIEDYQIKIVENNAQTRMEVQTEVHSLKNVVSDLIKANYEVKESLDKLSKSITETSESEKKEEEKKESEPCKICEEKDKTIKAISEEKDKTIRTLKFYLKIVSITAGVAILLTLLQLGLNFEPVKYLMKIIFNRG